MLKAKKHHQEALGTKEVIRKSPQSALPKKKKSKAVSGEQEPQPVKEWGKEKESGQQRVQTP